MRAAASAGIRPPVWVPETTSTQDAVRTWAMAQRPHGTALVAEHQTEGRGRMGRTWVADRGQALMLSVLLRPNLPPEKLGLVSLAAAVGVRQATRGRLHIKWPNDLLGRDGKKVAGLLAEGEIKDGKVGWVVMGLGLNVSGAPAEVPNAGFLEDYGPRLHAEELAVACIAGILEWTGRLETRPDQVLGRWRMGCETLGTRVRVGDHVGVALDVADDGGLTLRTDAGQLVTVHAGDVLPLPEDDA